MKNKSWNCCIYHVYLSLFYDVLDNWLDDWKKEKVLELSGRKLQVNDDGSIYFASERKWQTGSNQSAITLTRR